MLNLPNPLQSLDGTPITTPDQWPARRREILQKFEEIMYGRMPESDAGMTVRTLESTDTQVDGIPAIRKQQQLTFREGGPTVEVLIYLPKLDRPVGVFVGLNFGGNHTATTDPAVRLRQSDERIARLCNIERKRPTDADRGSAAHRWPFGQILKAGFGVATAWCDDIDPDTPAGRHAGVQPLFEGQGYTFATVAAWAWGLRRILDALLKDPSIDPKRIAIVGHSRMGKAALWAAAVDERFAIAISNESGCCGAAIKRRKQGERYKDITERFPHWFVPQLTQYNDREEECPIDQHLLLATIAPRPLYVASATDDAWADPLGEYLAAYHAGAVYRLLGKTPLQSPEPPAAPPACSRCSKGKVIPLQPSPPGHGACGGSSTHC